MMLAHSSCLFLLGFAIVIPLSTEGKKSCESELLQRCFARYKGLLKENPSDEQHCSRVQEVVSCFAENPSCKGKSVNRFRQWILKEAKLEVKLNICPRVNYNNLKVSVGNTDGAKENDLDSVDGDSSSSCAAKVHMTCNKRFLNLMSQNGGICGDAEEWFACYSKTASEQNCNSPIIKQYANFVERVGSQLVSDAMFANACKDEL